MTFDLYTADYKQTPYWRDAAPRPAIPEQSLPREVDVLVVGSGYTGLSAALQTARAGRSTLVVDAEDAGWGCSTRNGGQVVSFFKRGFGSLTAKYGRQTAVDILLEGYRAIDFLEDFIATENINCDWQRDGHFRGAHNARQYDLLAAGMKDLPAELDEAVQMVSRGEQTGEIGSDRYYGGAVFPKQAALHPAKLHAGLLTSAQSHGMQVTAHCRVDSIVRDGTGFRVATSKGEVRSGAVVIGTNGYTGPLTPWQRRRVIPIGSYIIATEGLAPALARELSPRSRTLSDTRRVVFYYRLSPDGTSMLFGGRVAYMETDPQISAPRLHDAMTAIFPQLKTARVSHSWMGFVAYTFDELPHVGENAGLYYAMGYCGVGTYLGMRLGQKVLGSADGNSPFDAIKFSSRPLYNGSPWFLAPSIAWYRMLDRLPC